MRRSLFWKNLCNNQTIISALCFCFMNLAISPRNLFCLILDPPGDAQIVQLETTLTENTAASFQCKSTGGYPAPTFKWMKNGRELSETSYEKSDTGGLSQSQVTITLTHVDDQRNLECNVIHVLQNKTANLQLNVECEYFIIMVIK